MGAAPQKICYGCKKFWCWCGEKFWCCEGHQKHQHQKDYQDHHRVGSGCFQSILEALEGDLHHLCFHQFQNHFPEIPNGSSCCSFPFQLNCTKFFLYASQNKVRYIQAVFFFQSHQFFFELYILFRKCDC